MAASNWHNQTIWTGDCLDIMRGMNSASVDLIYLDPPFNSKANYARPSVRRRPAPGSRTLGDWTTSTSPGMARSSTTAPACIRC